MQDHSISVANEWTHRRLCERMQYLMEVLHSFTKTSIYDIFKIDKDDMLVLPHRYLHCWCTGDTSLLLSHQNPLLTWLTDSSSLAFWIIAFYIQRVYRCAWESRKTIQINNPVNLAILCNHMYWGDGCRMSAEGYHKEGDCFTVLLQTLTGRHVACLLGLCDETVKESR